MRRLIVLLILFPVWAYGGCQGNPDPPRVATVASKKKTTPAKSKAPRHFNNTTAMNAFYAHAEQQAVENPEIARASDFISNPFMPVPEPALKQYLAQVEAPLQLVKDTVINVHNARYIDTLFQLNFDSSTVELYYPVYTKRFLLSYADVKSPNLALKNGLKVGSSRAELLQKLQGYKLFVKEQKNVIEVCDFERNSWLRFYLHKGRVASIQYEGYID